MICVISTIASLAVRGWLRRPACIIYQVQSPNGESFPETEKTLTMDFENKNFDSYYSPDSTDGVFVEPENCLLFIDYNTNGEWILGVLNKTNKKVVRVIDTHENIHTLARLAIEVMGVRPDKLWLSPSATTIALLSEVTKV